MITLAPTWIRVASWLGDRPRLAAVVRRVAPRSSGRVGARVRLSDTAEKTWVLAPAEAAVIAPAIFDEDDLALVTGVDADSSREIEWRRIRGGPLEHRPTTAYLLRDAVLSKGHVILEHLVRPYTTEPWPLWGRYDEVEHEPALLTATFNGSRYFGHWMMDELPRILAAPGIGRPVAPPRALSTHQRDYLKLLGLAQEERSDVLFRELVILDDRTQNVHRRKRYEQLRARARHGRRPVRSEGVMLLRRQTGVPRVLVNEEELAQRLEHCGFRTMCPTDHTVEAILDACMDARVIVGVEGSHMIHALLVMATGGSIVTIQPPNRFNNILKTYCDGLDLRYAFTVGRHCEGGFVVEPDRLLRLLDQLPAAPSNH